MVPFLWNFTGLLQLRVVHTGVWQVNCCYSLKDRPFCWTENITLSWFIKVLCAAFLFINHIGWTRVVLKFFWVVLGFLLIFLSLAYVLLCLYCWKSKDNSMDFLYYWTTKGNSLNFLCYMYWKTKGSSLDFFTIGKPKATHWTFYPIGKSKPIHWIFYTIGKSKSTHWTFYTIGKPKATHWTFYIIGKQLDFLYYWKTKGNSLDFLILRMSPHLSSSLRAMSGIMMRMRRRFSGRIFHTQSMSTGYGPG